MENEIIYRTITKEDVQQIANLHKSLFADHLLGMLSTKILYKFYLSYMDFEKVAFVGAFDSCNNCISFILGGCGMNLKKAKTKFLKQNFLAFIIEILTKWDALKLFIKSYLPFKKKVKVNLGVDKKRDYTLLSIGTSADYKGKGVSSSLLKYFEKRIKEFDKGESTINYGLSVHTDNLRAIGFYHKVGFEDCYKINGLLFLIKTI